MGRKRIHPIKPSPMKFRARGNRKSLRSQERRDCFVYNNCLTKTALMNKEAVPCADCDCYLHERILRGEIE